MAPKKRKHLSYNHLGDTKTSTCLQQNIKKISSLLPQKISHHNLPITKHPTKIKNLKSFQNVDTRTNTFTHTSSHTHNPSITSNIYIYIYIYIYPPPKHLKHCKYHFPPPTTITPATIHVPPFSINPHTLLHTPPLSVRFTFL